MLDLSMLGEPTSGMATMSTTTTQPTWPGQWVRKGLPQQVRGELATNNCPLSFFTLYQVVPASPGCSSPLLSPLSNDDLDDFLALKCNEIGDVEAAVAEFKMPQAEEVRKWLVMEEPEMHEANFIWTLHHHEDFPTLDTSTADLDRSLNVEMTDVPETLTALGLAEFLKAEKRKTNNKCCKKSRDKK